MENKLENMLRGRKFVAMIDYQTASVREKYNLKSAEVYVIMYLMKNHECNTARDINDQLKLTKGYISKVLDSLYQRGYINAVVDESDRRFVHYTLTEKSNPIVDEIKIVGERIRKGLAEGISREDIELVAKIAVQINDNIDRLMKD